MVIGGKLVFGHIGHQRVGNGNARRDNGVLLGRGQNQPLNGGMIAGQLGQLLTNMAGPLNTVVFRNGLGRTGHELQEGQFIRHRSEAVEFHKGQGH